MTKKEKLENVANIALSAGAIVSLLAGAKAISCLTHPDFTASIADISVDMERQKTISMG